MRIPPNILLPLAAAFLAACQPAPPLRSRAGIPQTPPPFSANRAAPVLETPAAAPRPQHTASPPRLSRKTIAGITFEGVSYDSRTHRLQVIDQPGGPGSIYQSSQDLAGKSNALLAINAGFFTPEGDPLGLVISGGKTSGGWNSASSLGSGIYRETSSGSAGIVRRGSRSSVSGSRELLQAGPLLVENGSAVSGLESQKTAVRSILLTDGGARWWIGITSPCTLAALAPAISQSSPAPWKVRMALNLDGGRSTDLFVSGSVAGGSINRRGFLNRPVRNFLVLREK